MFLVYLLFAIFPLLPHKAPADSFVICDIKVSESIMQNAKELPRTSRRAQLIDTT